MKKERDFDLFPKNGSNSFQLKKKHPKSRFSSRFSNLLSRLLLLFDTMQDVSCNFFSPKEIKERIIALRISCCKTIHRKIYCLFKIIIFPLSLSLSLSAGRKCQKNGYQSFFFVQFDFFIFLFQLFNINITISFLSK